MPNLVLVQPQAPIIWADAAFTGEDHVITLTGLAADAVRVGAVHDFGDLTAHSEWFIWSAHINGFAATTPVIGETVDIYLAWGDGTDEDGEVGTADAAGATVDLPNLKFIGHCVVQSVTETVDIFASGIVRMPARTVSMVVHNNTGDALAAATHDMRLTPIPPEIQ